MKEYCPLAVVSGIPTKSGIEFNHPLQKITVSTKIDTIWSILRHCDGMTKSEHIVKRVASQTNVDTQLVVDIIDDLTSLDILVDSRMAYKYFHKLGNNLSTFSASLTPSEISALQSSAHFAYKTGATYELDSPGSSVGELGSARFSCRRYSDDSIKESELSEILRVAYSANVTSSPSAGGMYPIRIYLFLVRSVGRFISGIYEYNSENHTLTCFKDEIDEQELEFALNSESVLYNAPVIMIVSSELDRQPTKYANRGYRYSLIEAGHVAQNVHLVSQELGLSTLEYCGFQDVKISEVLEISGTNVVPILTVAIGHHTDKTDGDTEGEFADRLVHELVGRGKPVNWLHLVNSPANEEELSFFYFSSHFRATGHDNAKASYKDRLCGGTSTSYSLAIAKAVAEGYERFQSGVIRTDCVETAESLNRDWLDPRIYAPYSDAQVERLDSLTRFVTNKNWGWTEGRNLVSGEKVLVPIDLVYYPLSSQRLGRDLCHYANSSGIAAHTTHEAATEGALLELMERDAIMRNWFQREVPTKIAQDMLPLHWRKRISYWAEREYEIDVLDMSRDGVCIINVVVHSEEMYPHFVTGTSASIESFEAALTKAFHEAELSLVVMREEGQKPMLTTGLLQPADHGLLYAQREYLKSVDYLWSGCYGNANEPSATLSSLIDTYRPTLVDLSGSYQTLKVVRVFAEKLIPTNFGYGVDHYTHKSLPEFIRQKHFSELEPHYLA